MGVIVKGNIDLNKIYNNEVQITLRYDENIIKRDRINYSIPQKVRFGMLPYQALLDYQAEKERQKEKPKKNKTFWENDEGDRQNVSMEEYEKILGDNGVDINSILGQNDVMAGLFDNIN